MSPSPPRTNVWSNTESPMNSSVPRYAFIGCGNMGRAMAKGLLTQKACPSNKILGIDPNPVARQTMHSLGITSHATAEKTLGSAGLVVLACKPQNAEEVCLELRPWLSAQQPVLSILAGVGCARLLNWLGERPVIRVMPNTPAQIGQGMSVYYARQPLTQREARLVSQLLQASGQFFAVKQETQLDAATAISGSGPAYAFFLAEHWMKAAHALGFDEEQSAQLVKQTLLGSAMLLCQNPEHISTLRQQITSKGGTTEAALTYFGENSMGEIIEQGIWRAFKRSQELGETAKNPTAPTYEKG